MCPVRDNNDNNKQLKRGCFFWLSIGSAAFIASEARFYRAAFFFIDGLDYFRWYGASSNDRRERERESQGT